MRAVLFDFDGTLADTAPDLGGALNRMRADRDLPALPIEAVRAYASSGARGLLRVGFGVVPGDARYEEMKATFLSHYTAAICVQTRLFPGIEELLDALESRGLAWGIVTNKLAEFTGPIVAQLGLATRVGCVVCGDTTPHAKPHPAPLLCAAAQLALAPRECSYVGDDLRDVQAARSARMYSVAVEYGYTGPDNGEPRTWNADAVIAHPLELLAYLPR